MKIIQKQWLALLLVIGIFLGSVSCVSQNTEDEGPIVRRDSAYFEAKEIVPEYLPTGDYQYRCQDIASKGDETAIVLDYLDSSDEYSLSVKDSAVIFLDAEGEQIAAVTIFDADDSFYSISATYLQDGHLAVLCFNQTLGYYLQIISSSTETVLNQIRLPSIQSHYQSLFEYEDYWIFLTYTSMIVTDTSGELISEFDLSSEPFDTKMFLVDGSPSIWVLSSSYEINIASLNIEGGLIFEKALENADEAYRGYELCREYVVDSRGVFRTDFSSDDFVEIADWNAIDIKPSKYIANMTKHYVLDDETIIRSVEPMVSMENDELIFMKHREINPHADKPVLTIGGYGVMHTDAILYAAYLYNTGDYEYRIQLVDYNDKYGVPHDLAGMARARAEMISDMNSGNSEDIFFGYDFNYNIWGQSGIVEDLVPLIENDSDFDLNDLVPSIVSLLDYDGHIYQIFPSFEFRVFVGFSDVLTATDQMTIEQTLWVGDQLSDHQRLYHIPLKVEMAIAAIQYSLDDFFTEDSGFSISMDELQYIVEYAERFGITEADLEYITLSDPYLAYVTERMILMETTFFTPHNFHSFEQMGTSEMQVFGIPSIHDDIRHCYGYGTVAISAGSQDVDACWDFIKILFSEELQNRMIAIGRIPVLNDMFELQIEKVMNPSLMTPEEELLYMFSNTSQPMSADTAQRYRDAVDSLNALYFLDIDLRLILWEELSAYFDGAKPLNEVHNALNNRMNLFINEMRS